jgi:hypothetical protein
MAGATSTVFILDNMVVVDSTSIIICLQFRNWSVTVTVVKPILVPSATKVSRYLVYRNQNMFVNKSSLHTVNHEAFQYQRNNE